MLKYLIKTYGCQMNYSDTERIASKLEEMGFKECKTEQSADMIIFNTCSVKQKAENKVFGQMIKMQKLRKANKDLIVAITGCMVRRSSHKKSEKPDKLVKKLKQLDLVFRINDLAKLPKLIKELRPKWFKNTLSHKTRKTTSERLSAKRNNTVGILREPTEYSDYFKTQPKYCSNFQAFVPIMTGCDKFCSYCIVPFSRGREQSRPMQDILDECQKLVEKGCKEITLLGQNVNSYGLSPIDFDSGEFDLKERQKLGLRTNLKNPPFVKLLKKLNELKSLGLRRLRYTSPHPYDMSDELIKAHTKLETLCEHIHLPVQSGDNDILKSMNRHYTAHHYLDLIKKIKKAVPNIGLTTDIIVGFPGETEEQFEKTYELANKVRWNMIFNSRYSPRRGTYSADKLKDDVTVKEKARRWHRLNDLLKVCSQEKNDSFVKKTVSVLVEKHQDGICIGRSRENIETQFSGTKDLIGKEVDVIITDADTWIIKGKIV